MDLPLRAYALEARDLDVDFAAAPPNCITTLILACQVGDSLDAEAVEAMPVGDRLAALVKILRLSGSDRLDITSACTGCGELLEVPIALAEVLALHADARSRPHAELSAGAGTLSLRRPTGRDQLHWLQMPPSRAELVAQLCVAPQPVPPLDGEMVAAAAEALDALDPLVNLTAEVVCPECGHRGTHAVELQRRLLHGFAARQHALVRNVHRLALCYHWNERQILALPPRRRAQYLALLDAD